MAYILKSLRPFISLEVAGGEEWKENCQRSIKILLNNDYQVLEITPEGKLTNHIVKENYEKDNLIFIPKEKINTSRKLLI